MRQAFNYMTVIMLIIDDNSFQQAPPTFLQSRLLALLLAFILYLLGKQNHIKYHMVNIIIKNVLNNKHDPHY